MSFSPRQLSTVSCSFPGSAWERTSARLCLAARGCAAFLGTNRRFAVSHEPAQPQSRRPCALSEAEPRGSAFPGRAWERGLRGLRALLLVGCVLALASSASAAKVKVWNHHSPGDYDHAQLKQTVVSNEGVIRLSRQLKPFANVDATHVWDVVEDRDGNLYAATGDDGKIYKVTPAGKASVAYSGDDSQVFCLALAPDGSIYAGTGPSGRVIRIAPDGTAKLHYQTPESYVWSLALNEKGDKLFAGTGPKGRIYSVSPEGKGSVFYTTKQEHILCMAMGAKDTLYAGTDKGGLVYRIDAQGKGFVLYSAPQSEVRSLLVTPAGVYAGTSAPVKRRSSGGGTASGDKPSLSSGGVKALPVSASRPNEESRTEDVSPPKSSSSSSSSDGPKSSPAPAASPPSTGENCVFFIRADGTVREIFREKALVLSMLKQDGRLLVGTGMEGQLFEIDEATKERTEIARLDHGQIHCLKRRRDGSIILGAGDPGKLYTLQDRFAARGTMLSEVLDAKIISKWGSLRWSATTPDGTTLTLAARSGNVAEPDETWSDWSAEQSDGRQAQIVAPAARFLQYRVTLGSDNPAASPRCAPSPCATPRPIRLPKSPASTCPTSTRSRSRTPRS